MRLHSGYSDIYEKYLAPNANTIPVTFSNNPRTKNYSSIAKYKLSHYFKEPSFRAAFSEMAWNQFLLQMDRQQLDEDMLSLLEYYLLQKLLYFKELTDDPRTSVKIRETLASFLWSMGESSSSTKKSEDNVALRFLKDFERVKICYNNKVKHPPSNLHFDNTEFILLDFWRQFVLNRNFHRHQIKALNSLDQMISCAEINLPQISLLTTPKRWKKLSKDQSYSFLEFDPREIDNTLPTKLISATGFTDGNTIAVLRTNGLPTDQNGFIAYHEKLKAIESTVFEKNLKEQWGHKDDFTMIQDMLLALQEAENLGVHPVEHVFQLTDNIIYEDEETTLTEEDLFHFRNHPLYAQYSYSSPYRRTQRNHILDFRHGIYGVPSTRGRTSRVTSQFEYHQVFRKVVSALDSAPLFVLIDPFFFKGTTGLSIIYRLISRLNFTGTHFRLIVLERDRNFSQKNPEVRILFNFMRAYMALKPDRVLALPSPTKEEPLNNWKHLFINPQEKRTEKFFSINSEDWTEVSNYPAHYSKSSMFNGPIVAVLFNNYYHIVYNALKHDWKASLNPDYNIEYRNFLSNVYENVASEWAKRCNIQNIEHLSLEEKIKSALCPIDFMHRYKNIPLKNFSDYDALTDIDLKKTKAFLAHPPSSPPPQKIQLTTNNLKTSHNEPLEQILSSISRARKQILIQGNILNSPRLVESLVQKKKQGVNIFILSNAPKYEDLNRIAKSLYSQLRTAGIPIKPEPHFNDDHLEQIQQRKGKILSIDGFNSRNESLPGTPVYIMSSSHPLSSSEEFQILTFDEVMVATHDSHFWFLWTRRPH